MPTTTVVTPCRRVLGISGSTNGDRSEWLCTSMKPGETDQPPSVDRAGARRRRVGAVTDRGDPIAGHRHPSGDARRSGAVDDGGVRDQEVHRRATLTQPRVSRWAGTRGTRSRRRRAPRPTRGRRAARRTARTSDRPMPTPGEWPLVGPGRLFERLEDRFAHLVGHPRPSSSTPISMPPSVARAHTKTRASGRRMAQGVRDEVLDDALDLGSVHGRGQGPGLDVDRAAVGVLDLREDRARSTRRCRSSDAGGTRSRAADGRGPADRRATAPACARSTPRGGRGPGRRPGGMFELALLQRQRRAQDRGERRPQIVRHRLQERVLHLVERAELLRGLALAQERLRVLALGVAQRLFGVPAFGDVDHQPSDLPRRPGPPARPSRDRGATARRRLRLPTRYSELASVPSAIARRTSATASERSASVMWAPHGWSSQAAVAGAEEVVDPAGEERDAAACRPRLPRRPRRGSRPARWKRSSSTDPPGVAERQRREVADAARQTQRRVVEGRSRRRRPPRSARRTPRFPLQRTHEDVAGSRHDLDLVGHLVDDRAGHDERLTRCSRATSRRASVARRRSPPAGATVRPPQACSWITRKAPDPSRT